MDDVRGAWADIEDAVVAVLTPARRRALAAALLLLVAAILAGRHLAGAGAAQEVVAAPVALETGPAAAPVLLVHVVGAVREPGLYRLREGDRVADAVDRAGGATAKADLASLNLAAPVADGIQVVVPRRGPAGGSGAVGAVRSGGGGGGSGPVRLNAATVEELDTLPGVGPVTAQKIVDWRQAHGAFRSVEDLAAIPGIGPKRIAQLRDLVVP
jgi:competence protein ComEA